MNDGRLEAVWVKRMKRGPMDAVQTAVLEAGLGLAGNADRGGRRQVTIVSRERWDAITRTLGHRLDPLLRRANLMVSGIELARSRGRILVVGSTRLRINGETRPCWQMEEAHPGLQAAMEPEWGGGAFAEVVTGGDVRVGDPVGWELPLLDAIEP